MDQHAFAVLRARAHHCRELARAVNDQRSIEALHETAREFDEEAERIAREPTPAK